MSRRFDESLSRALETVGLVVVGDAIADELRVTLTPSRRHILNETCWCNPILIASQSLTVSEDLWLHRTEYEAN